MSCFKSGPRARYLSHAAKRPAHRRSIFRMTVAPLRSLTPYGRTSRAFFTKNFSCASQLLDSAVRPERIRTRTRRLRMRAVSSKALTAGFSSPQAHTQMETVFSCRHRRRYLTTACARCRANLSWSPTRSWERPSQTFSNTGKNSPDFAMCPAVHWRTTSAKGR